MPQTRSQGLPGQRAKGYPSACAVGAWPARRLASVAFILVVVALALGSRLALAQTPTPEQLKMLESLPPDQRQALLEQLSGSGAAGGATATPQDEIAVREPSLTTATDSVTQQDNAAEAAQRAKAQRTHIKGGEQLLIEVTVPPAVQPGPDRIRLEDMRKRIIAHNPYELTRFGVLQLPGIDPIPLAGLTSKEVLDRLALDPMLRDLRLSVTVLKLDAQGVHALKPFGYEMFRAGATAFVPGTDIPVPESYKIGAGDVMNVQLYGQRTKTYSLPVLRDGTIGFPELGPLAVGGMGLGAAQGMLEKRVRQQMVGTQARVTLTELRSQRVLVLGDAEKPGSYVVSALASVTDALFASGGVQMIGSLRKIEVRRAGQLLRRLDLYDVLLKGDTANDVSLQTGDVVFVPPVGATVGIDGEIRRPAIYELARERSLKDLVALAGGMTAEADPTVVTIERVGATGEREALSVNLNASGAESVEVRNGDTVRIGAVRPVIDNGIALDGHVYGPGTFAWHEGIRLSDVIRSVDELKPHADQHYVLIRREAKGTRRLSVISADLAAALAARGSSADVPLERRDRLTVFDIGSPRDQTVNPLLEELGQQSRPDAPAGVVYIDGPVHSPGTYPLEPGMRVSDLLRAGGGLDDSAYGLYAELTRQTIEGGERRVAKIQTINLERVRAGDAEANVPLEAYDSVQIKTTPEWHRLEYIELVGEVRFPGRYQIRRGESLSSIVQRAGGLTPIAFPHGAVFTREDLKKREREQLDQLATRMQSELATLALQSQAAPNAAGSAEAMAAGQGLLAQLRATKPVGRLVIDVEKLVGLRVDPRSDITLRDGDRLVIPRTTEEVSVFGEVQNPTSHVYHPGLTRDQLIALSGGLTYRADHKRAYIVRADGSVVVEHSGWRRSGNSVVEPGDSVVVPIDAEKMRPLTLWTAVTTIIYNLAIATTAIARL